MPDKTMILKVSEEEHRKIKMLAAETGRTIKDLMMECLQRLIKEYEEAKSE